MLADLRCTRCIVSFLITLGSTFATFAQTSSIASLPWVRHDPRNRGVIVFVHGVTGDDRSTWTSGAQFWPAMLTRDRTFDGQDIYVYRYPSPRFQAALTVDELADNMRLVLTTDDVLGHDEVTFVSHSMGGIVTRAFILRYRNVVPKIRFLYFFATPTTGSPYAKLASLFSPNPQFKALFPIQSDGYLGQLQSDWLAANLGLKSYCAFETQPYHGQIIVERQSATNLCNQRLDPIDANHVDIVKPTDERSNSYRALKAAFMETMPQNVDRGGRAAVGGTGASMSLEMIFANPALLSVIGRNNSKSITAKDPSYIVSLWNLDEPNAFQGLPSMRRSDLGDFLKPGDFGFGPYAIFDLTGPNAPLTVGRIKQGDRLFGFGSIDCSNCGKISCYWIWYVYGVGGWYAAKQASNQQTCQSAYSKELEEVKSAPRNLLLAVPEASRRIIGGIPGQEPPPATVSLHCRQSGPVVVKENTQTYVLETFPDVPRGFFQFSSGEQLWPDPKTRNDVFIIVCDLTSHEVSPLFDVALSFTLTSIEAKKGATQNQIIGGRILSSSEHVLEIPELTQGSAFTFYIHNSTEEFVRVREPIYATAETRGSTARITVALKRETSSEAEFTMLPAGNNGSR